MKESLVTQQIPSKKLLLSVNKLQEKHFFSLVKYHHERVSWLPTNTARKALVPTWKSLLTPNKYCQKSFSCLSANTTIKESLKKYHQKSFSCLLNFTRKTSLVSTNLTIPNLICWLGWPTESHTWRISVSSLDQEWSRYRVLLKRVWTLEAVTCQDQVTWRVKGVRVEQPAVQHHLGSSLILKVSLEAIRGKFDSAIFSCKSTF